MYQIRGCRRARGYRKKVYYAEKGVLPAARAPLHPRIWYMQRPLATISAPLVTGANPNIKSGDHEYD